MTTEEWVTVFYEADIDSWGWQCFICTDTEDGYGNATTAREAADNHAALPHWRQS